MINLEQCYLKNSQIITKEVDGEIVLLDPYRRAMVRLNTVAAEIFSLIDGERSVSMIIFEMRQRFDVQEDIVRRDVLAVLKEFIKKEIIV